MKPDQAGPDFYKQMFGGSWITQGISVAADLGIADLLADGPQPVAQLAARTQSHPDSLYRVLRALAAVGVFSEGPDGSFSQTPLSEKLRSNVPDSQRSFAIMMGSEFYQAWGELMHSVRTGRPGFDKRFGAKCFEYLMSHPDRHAIYDAAMGGFGRAETAAVLDVYDFSAFATVADIGGGSGSLVKAVLGRYSAIAGILFDLPPVAERTRAMLAESKLADRCRAEGGDFFQSIPSGADAYVMQHIIHDWDDAEAIAILTNCRKAMAGRGKLLLVEMVIPEGNQPSFGKWLDLMMLLISGRERTEAQYARLLAAAGLQISRIVPTAADVSVIEAVPASQE